VINCAAIKQGSSIYIGQSHSEIFSNTFPLGCLRNAEQGFVTDDGVFVNRAEALVIALQCNQIKHKHGSPSELYSEDLYSDIYK
jgi:hypothetical protein